MAQDDHGRRRPRAPTIHVRNEFCAIEISVNSCANGPRIVVHDLNTGLKTHLDLLELESLTRGHPDFSALVRPA